MGILFPMIFSTMTRKSPATARFEWAEWEPSGEGALRDWPYLQVRFSALHYDSYCTFVPGQVWDHNVPFFEDACTAEQRDEWRPESVVLRTPMEEEEHCPRIEADISTA